MASFESNANTIPLINKKSMHLQIGIGDVVSRIITVGSSNRLDKMITYLDTDKKITIINSNRGFKTATGYYKNVPVSVIAIGMGTAMMDFFVREVSAVTEGPLVIVRYGTCGGIALDTHVGSVSIASGGSGMITKNYQYFNNQIYNNTTTTTTTTTTQTQQSHRDNINESSEIDDSKTTATNSITQVQHVYIKSSSNMTNQSLLSPYIIHDIIPSDSKLNTLLRQELQTLLGSDLIYEGINFTADSFYASQGRQDPNFHDDNDTIISYILEKYPLVRTLEMETYQLFHLSQCAKRPIYCSAVTMILANRNTGEFASDDVIDILEYHGGLALLNAIIQYNI